MYIAASIEEAVKLDKSLIRAKYDELAIVAIMVMFTRQSLHAVFLLWNSQWQDLQAEIVLSEIRETHVINGH